MLKALELQGFKSFADKTRFDFPPGITVVVGPNGSGKSNIVDAIKWVLGEQSAKSMRGKEMADVIFKGSGKENPHSVRKQLNSAEASIIFDNSSGLLPIDAAEVQVTRRVYRSGEGEYLINKHPCRLRDIRDLCSGTGVGADAYSIIEQGKVDTMLQASAKDRRAIFEEAAGISRFKSKKLETQRRLLRIDQNLIRLADIVDEVESRLKSVRNQAGKARRYQEYSQRLQELRTYVGMVDWRALSTRLEEYEVELSQLRDETQAEIQTIESCESQSSEIATELQQLSEQFEAIETELARSVQRVATLVSSTRLQYRQLHDLTGEIDTRRKNIQKIRASLSTLEADVTATETLLSQSMQQKQTVDQELGSVEEVLKDLEASITDVRKSREQRRKEHVELLKTAASLDNSIGSIQATIDAARQRKLITSEELFSIRENLDSQSIELQSLNQQEQELHQNTEEQKSELDQAKQHLSQHRKELHDLQQHLSNKQNRRAAAFERSVVLEELEKRYEGLNTGVKEVLSRSQDQKDFRFRSVVGLVADIFQVEVEIAELIEIALGEAAHHIVLQDNVLIEAIQDAHVRLPGRVGFLQLSLLPSHDTDHNSSVAQRVHEIIESNPAILGKASLLVDCDSDHQKLAEHLLGKTLIIDQLSSVAEIKNSLPKNYRFVTQNGELLEADGRIVLGPRSNAGGIISRRSELRALRDELTSLDSVIEKEEAKVAQMQATIMDTDQHLQEVMDKYQLVSDQLTNHRARKKTVELRVEDLKESLTQREEQVRELTDSIESSEEELGNVREQIKAAGDKVTELESKNAQDSQKIQDKEVEKSQIALQITSLKVDLAKSEQQIESLQRQLQQAVARKTEKLDAITHNQTKLATDHARYLEIESELLRANAELAELFLIKENHDTIVRHIKSRRTEIETEKNRLHSITNDSRQSLRKIEDKIHRKELAAGDIKHERATMATRLKEDYGIELAELEGEPDAEQAEERASIDEEISELRRKVSNIGAVNTDALNELQELEARYESLATQLQDLTDAKESLEKIINKINADSRRLFEETFNTVKANFQVLFRKVFGGGTADIKLEEGVDILESGIEIVATPPGKNELNISLLSGGERALTAVTLLLAIFQFRPSPFCVLDEVDGPLDEANIGRFIDVLREFLDWTQFVIVTHSKTTMSAATTLYGVTMQESGISKQVAVQFEDVSEDGHITERAINRSVDSNRSNEVA